MSKPTGYIIRQEDMKNLLRNLNRPSASLADVFDAARTLVGFAEPQQTQQTQLPPVHVAFLALPLDEPANVPAVDALERVHALAIQALGRGTDVSPGALLDITDVEPQPYDMPSPAVDALDRIADAYLSDQSVDEALSEIAGILVETGRAL